MLIYTQQNLSVDPSLHDHWLACWYNGPQREAHMNRVVFSVGSAAAENWSRPTELFPSVNGHGEENEPFVIVNGRLYGAASDALLGNAHDSGQQGGLLMRRIHSSSALGPIFWAANSVPADVNASYPLYSDMDHITAHDAAQYLASLVNQTVQHGNSALGPGTVAFNERSMYALPANLDSTNGGSFQHGPEPLAMLLRYGGGSPKSKQRYLWGSRCVLPPPTEPVLPDNAQSGTFSCRSGTGAYEYEIPSNTDATPTVKSSATTAYSRQCNWSTPVETNLPDAPSRTCAGRLPSTLGIGLVGNQGMIGANPTTPRDPLTFCAAKDGLKFDRHWVVDSGAPVPKWFGYRGFQYPSFTWCTDGCQPPAVLAREGARQNEREGASLGNVILFSYSISKEDIVLTKAPLSSIE
jgi:predicted heme/steroid binding protein